MDTSKIIIGTVGGGRYTVTAPIINKGNDTVSVFTDESVGTTITLKIEKHT